MNYEVRATPRFERRLKQLARKYRRVGQDFAPLTDLLTANPRAGDSIPGFGDTVFKIRLASSDMKKGKSGGLDESARVVHLLTIYAKSEQENPDPNELQDVLAELSQPIPPLQDETQDATQPTSNTAPPPTSEDIC